jgi:AcrR family transcriptional regulator
MGRRSDHSREELLEMAVAAATKIVAKQGLKRLSTRLIAARMGYSAGTLYQLFDNLDDIILHVNARTLEGLSAACRDVDFAAGPEASLYELARRYIDYTGRNPNLWAAVFEHSLPRGRTAPKWYAEKSGMLLEFGERAITPLFGPDEETARRHEANVLWAGLYGIGSLATTGKLPASEEPELMALSLIRNYLVGLRERNVPISAAGAPIFG